MVSNSAQLDRRTKLLTVFGVSAVTVPEIWPGQNCGGRKEKRQKKKRKKRKKK